MYMVQVDHRVACKVDGTHIHVGYLYLRKEEQAKAVVMRFFSRFDHKTKAVIESEQLS